MSKPRFLLGIAPYSIDDIFVFIVYTAFMDKICQELLLHTDNTYADFQRKLIPTVSPESIQGVRTPDIRAVAKQYAGTEEASLFLYALPHRLFEENQLHAFLLSSIKDFDTCLAGVEAFLSYIDNWATCDQLSPAVFKKNRDKLLPFIERWLHSSHTYTIRFGIKVLMQYFLDDGFQLSYAQNVAEIRSTEYYVNMMIAWYFATALAKQYTAVLPLIESRSLECWTQNKAIQKAIESRRLSPEQKEYLRTLKR